MKKSERSIEMKKLRTLSLAILAMTLITSALFAPFAFAQQSDVQADPTVFV